MANDGKNLPAEEVAKLVEFETAYLLGFQAANSPTCVTSILSSSLEPKARWERARQDLAKSPRAVALLKSALRNSKLTAPALEVVESLTPEQTVELLEDITPFALQYGHPFQKKMATLIRKKISRADLKANLESAIMAVLQNENGESGEWEEAILLTQVVLPDLSTKLVQLALVSEDPGVQDVGKKFLK